MMAYVIAWGGWASSFFAAGPARLAFRGTRRQDQRDDDLAVAVDLFKHPGATKTLRAR